MSGPSDPWNDPRTQAYLRRAQRELLPMIKGTAITMAIAPDEPDAKSAIELGFSILLDKPLIVIAPVGRIVPLRLKRAADAVIFGSPGDPEVVEQLREAMRKLGIIDE